MAKCVPWQKLWEKNLVKNYLIPLEKDLEPLKQCLKSTRIKSKATGVISENHKNYV